jgi:hypothetical protein
MLISSTSPTPSLRAHYSATAAPAVAKPAAATTKEQEELLEMDIHTFDQRASAPFRLSSKFVSKFKDKQPPFGFNGLGGTIPFNSDDLIWHRHPRILTPESEFVYRRTYSRLKKDGSKEEWYGFPFDTLPTAHALPLQFLIHTSARRHETVERVVNGTYNMQKKWIETHQLGWNPWKAQKSAQEMYTRIYEMKFLPPGTLHRLASPRLWCTSRRASWSSSIADSCSRRT